MRASRLFAMVAVLGLLIAACSGDDGGGEDETSSPTENGTEGVPASELVVAADAASRAMEALAAAYAEETGEEVLVRAGSPQEISSDFAAETPAIYVNTTDFVTGDVPDGAIVAPLGTDVLQLGVLRGNPAGVTGLEVFAAGSDVPAGICRSGLQCGRAATQVFEQAGIEPGPQVAEESVGGLLNGLTRDESLDAVLLFRTDLRRRFALVEQVPITERVSIDYDIALLTDDERLIGFYDWVATSEDAQVILQQRGLAALTPS
ncbi:MAG: substrate-binding domain-containing protein [Acidimicrobiia bacterium]|nr:substrate-binding domain-containing protein [Acidimicrobiia bacterium]